MPPEFILTAVLVSNQLYARKAFGVHGLAKKGHKVITLLVGAEH